MMSSRVARKLFPPSKPGVKFWLLIGSSLLVVAWSLAYPVLSFQNSVGMGMLFIPVQLVAGIGAFLSFSYARHVRTLGVVAIVPLVVGAGVHQLFWSGTLRDTDRHVNFLLLRRDREAVVRLFESEQLQQDCINRGTAWPCMTRLPLRYVYTSNNGQVGLSRQDGNVYVIFLYQHFTFGEFDGFLYRSDDQAADLRPVPPNLVAVWTMFGTVSWNILYGTQKLDDHWYLVRHPD